MSTRSEAAVRDAENRRARLRQWIDENFGGVQAAFVARHSLNQGEISALLKDKSFGSVKARNLEAKTGMPERYLDARDGEVVASGYHPGNTAPGPEIKGVYPLLSNVQAGAWTELCASFSREDAQDWYPSTKSLGPCGYMLRVKGRSMENPGGSPSFTEGMILHINPDLDPTPGLYVIVRRSGSDEATFKKYIHIDGIPYLEAINPDWPKDQKYLRLMPGDVWCGVVVDASLGGLV